MLLAFDVGNTNIKIGLLETSSDAGAKAGANTGANAGTEVHAKMRISSQLERTADEYFLFLEQFLSRHSLDWSSLEGVIISSVVPIITGELNICLENRISLPYLILGPGVRTGLKIRTEQPQELGADLVANAVGAHWLLQKQSKKNRACIAVAFGTATTFTCVSSAGELWGVAIAPGIETALRSLVKNTALLRQVRLEMPERAIGRNTQEALRAGLILGNLGAVERIIEQQKSELQEEAAVITTGFFGQFYQEYSATLEHYEEDLLFIGLAEIWKRNQAG